MTAAIRFFFFWFRRINRNSIVRKRLCLTLRSILSGGLLSFYSLALRCYLITSNALIAGLIVDIALCYMLHTLSIRFALVWWQSICRFSFYIINFHSTVLYAVVLLFCFRCLGQWISDCYWANHIGWPNPAIYDNSNTSSFIDIFQ